MSEEQQPYEPGPMRRFERRMPEFPTEPYRINLKTDVYADGMIEQFDDLRGQITRRFLDTREHQVREALIMLGWTPPPADWELQAPDTPQEPPEGAKERVKDAARVKGGKARAASLSAARRSEIARNAARARWGKTDG